MSKMAYTCRQLNSTNTALSYFHVAVLCKLEQAEMVKTGLMKCFDSAEIAYHYDKSKPGKDLYNYIYKIIISVINVQNHRVSVMGK